MSRYGSLVATSKSQSKMMIKIRQEREHLKDDLNHTFRNGTLSLNDGPASVELTISLERESKVASTWK